MQTVFDAQGNPHQAITVWRFDPRAERHEITGTARLFYACHQCRTSWAKDSAATLSTIVQEERMFVRLQSTLVRRVLDRVIVDGGTLARCSCGATVTGKVLETGATSTTRCDQRCADAKGHECNCDCGGLNHGTGIRLSSAA